MRLALIEGPVCTLHQRHAIAGFAVLPNRYANTDCHFAVNSIDVLDADSLDCAAHVLSDNQRTRLVRCRKEHGELFATETGDKVRGRLAHLSNPTATFRRQSSPAG